MNKFDLDAYNKMSMTFKDVIRQQQEYNKQLSELILSKEHYQDFLKHHCDEDWVGFSDKNFSLEYRDDGMYVIRWSDTFHDETEHYKTEPMSRETVEKFLNEDDCMKEILERQAEIEKAREEREAREQEEWERAEYERLKEKYEKD